MLYEDVEVRPGRTLRLYYRKVSDGSSPSRSDTIILFLHGVGGCALLWEKQMDYLFDQGYDVYAPDFYGHGDSQHPGELEQKHYTFIELREDILALFDWINPTACVIVSHSYGASFSHYLCKERESQVTQLVEISGSHPRPLKTHCCSIYRLPVCCFNTCGDYLRRGFMALAFSQPAPADAAPAYNLTPEMFKYVMRGQVWREHTREYCACITQPTLLIVGSQDNFVSLSEVQETEEVIPGARLVIFNGVGHMVMLEVPEQLNVTMLDFIKPTITDQPTPQPWQPLTTRTKIYSRLL